MPVEVAAVGSYLDGGSYGVRFLDADGRVLALRIDRRMRSPEQNTIGPDTWGLLLTSSGCEPERGVGRGAGIGRAASLLIHRWLETTYSEAERILIRGLDRPPPLRGFDSPEDTRVARAWEAFWVADSLAAYDTSGAPSSN